MTILQVLAPGFYSTVQDLGRSGFSRFGVSVGGSADSVALRVGNRLAGNIENAAAIEMTALGGTFRFMADTWFSLAGSECGAKLDAQNISSWVSIPVCAGQILECRGVKQGFRSYLCVHGGIGVNPILRSRSTHCSGAWGGFGGRALQAGDELPLGDCGGEAPHRRSCSPEFLNDYFAAREILRVVRGPQWELFGEEVKKTFLASDYRVTDDVSRNGLRLAGNAIAALQPEDSLISEGIANGAVQIPAGGQPILLFCEQRSSGGYSKIVNVIRRDLYKIGQLAPRDS